jgi:hypothetical protein
MLLCAPVYCHPVSNDSAESTSRTEPCVCTCTPSPIQAMCGKQVLLSDNICTAKSCACAVERRAEV